MITKIPFQGNTWTVKLGVNISYNIPKCFLIQAGRQVDFLALYIIFAWHVPEAFKEKLYRFQSYLNLVKAVPSNMTAISYM